MNKFTPGTWKYTKTDPGYGTVYSYQIWSDHYKSKRANMLATVTGHGYLSDEVVEANACIMAAALDLLKALIGLVDVVDSGKQTTSFTTQQAIIAIAKATGGSHDS